MATLKTAAGPIVKIRTSPLALKKSGCYRVLMRNQRPGPHLGRWEPVSTSGFLVVCGSYLEAAELVWMVGGRHFPRPPYLDKGDDHDEERYLDWLLSNHFKIEPYQASGHLEVLFSEFIRGWYPDASDIPALGKTGMAPFVEALLRSRWQGR